MQVIRLAVMISAKTNVEGLIDVDYLVNVTPDHEETFVMDTLGNRSGNQTLTDGTVNFTVQSSTNRYTSIGGNGITRDDAGNMTTDKDEYEYFYDYENRLVKIEDSSSVEVATCDYDALGRCTGPASLLAWNLAFCQWGFTIWGVGQCRESRFSNMESFRTSTHNGNISRADGMIILLYYFPRISTRMFT